MICSLSRNLCSSLYVCLSVCLCQVLPLCLCLSLSVFLSLCLCLSLSLSVCLFLSLSVCLSLCLPVCLSDGLCDGLPNRFLWSDLLVVVLPVNEARRCAAGYERRCCGNSKLLLPLSFVFFSFCSSSSALALPWRSPSSPLALLWLFFGFQVQDQCSRTEGFLVQWGLQSLLAVFARDEAQDARGVLYPCLQAAAARGPR